MGGACVRGFFPRSVEDRPGGVPRFVAGDGQWRGGAGNPRRARGCRGRGLAPPPQRQRSDLCAVRGLGRGGGGRVHQAVRGEQDRKSGGEGKSVSGSGDHGGRGSSNKKKNKKI